MCGINGFILNSNYCDSRDAASLIKKMNERLVHRGPDAEGLELFITENNIIALGHRRLSIIDLSNSANQPIYDINRKACIVFNGEIYNYKELKNELITCGYKFLTNSDTEVIINAYLEYGYKCLDKLNGIFSFAIYDSIKEEMFIARDRIGVKPLVYSYSPNRYFIFSSEIKGILEHHSEDFLELDYTGMNYYFTIGYIPYPHTIYKNIKKLEPGSFIVLNKSFKIIKYWHPDYTEDHTKSFGYYLEGLRHHLKRSVKMQLVSDVPVGAFLSGGIDSSAVVSLMSQNSTNQIKTFSIGFKDKYYNELRYARLVANKNKTKHYEKILTPDPIQFFSNILKVLDEPFADTSSIPTFLVSEMASKEVKVVLSGDGGDELFAGYDWHIANYYLNKIPNFLTPFAKQLLLLTNYFPYSKKKKAIINILQKLANGWKLPEAMHSMKWHCVFNEMEKRELFCKNFPNDFKNLNFLSFIEDKTGSKLQDFLFFDLNLYLPNDDLVKVDLMSMANSIESRVPLLDHELVEFAARIPYKYKNIGTKTKVIFKEALKDTLPEEILNRKQKQGFSIPINYWFHNELRDLTYSSLIQMDSNFLDKKYVLKLFNDHLSFKKDNSAKLRSIIIWLSWEQNNKMSY